MILVFILLAIIVIISILFLLILFSTFRIELDSLELSNIGKDAKKTNIQSKDDLRKNLKPENKTKNKSENIQQDIQKESKQDNKNNETLIFSLYLANKIKWLSIKLGDRKIKKIYHKINLEKIDIKKLEKEFKLEDLRVLGKIKPKIGYFNLKADLGASSPIITAFLIAGGATIISNILAHYAKDNQFQNYQYVLTPIYDNKILYKIKFNCIIEIKMVHIINVIYIFIKKGRSDKNERTTSNRKSYGYSYE